MSKESITFASDLENRVIHLKNNFSMRSIYDFDRESQTVVVNGVTMLLSEYRKMKRAEQRKKKKAKQQNEIKLLPREVKTLMKSTKIMRSLSSYYDWSYKMWGRIAKMILHDKDIESPFLNYRIHAREALAIVEDIKTIGGKGEKNVFQFILKLSWKMADIREDLAMLYNGVKESGVCRQFRGHECIVGSKDGKRLGLQQLMDRTYDALDDLDNIVAKLDTIQSNGVDVLTIENHMSLKEKNKVC